MQQLLKNCQLDTNGHLQNIPAIEELLARLIAFDTSSSHSIEHCRSNIEMLTAVKTMLDEMGCETLLQEETDPAIQKKYGRQANLIARIGPGVKGGLLFSGHSDVVVAEASQWQTPPFELTAKDDKLFARGSVDMKSAIANFLVVMANAKKLDKPIYLALSWGEEIGCMGSASMCALLEQMQAVPDLIVVGEPTGGKIVIGNKGGSNINLHLKGIGGHSSQPEKALNAIYYSTVLIDFVKEQQQRFQENKALHDDNFDPPYPVINLGYIQGGVAANAIAEDCLLGLHVRPTPNFDLDKEVIAPLNQILSGLNVQMKADAAKLHGKPDAELVKLSYSKPLLVDQDEDSLQNILKVYQETLTPMSDCISTVSFATEAGQLYEWLKTKNKDGQIIVFAMGDMMKNNAHKVDEFISRDELVAGLPFYLGLVKYFCCN